MKPETISIITRILQSEVNNKKAILLRYIESCVSANKAIEEYQELFLALQDFNKWCEEQEFEDETD